MIMRDETVQDVIDKRYWFRFECGCRSIPELRPPEMLPHQIMPTWSLSKIERELPCFYCDELTMFVSGFDARGLGVVREGEFFGRLPNDEIIH